MYKHESIIHYILFIEISYNLIYQLQLEVLRVQDVYVFEFFFCQPSQVIMVTLKLPSFYCHHLHNALQLV